MPNIQPVNLDSASPDQKKILEGLKARMGKIKNIYATVAHSPSTLEAMMGYNAGLKKGSLTGKEIEAIALVVGEMNVCNYCLAAHTVTGKMAGLSPEELMASRKGQSLDPKTDALLKLSVEIVETKGRPSQDTVDRFRQAGYGDAALVEVVAWVTFSIFTNYINHVAGTEVDFPQAPALA
jgi:uncharacterized peroxidase-related enzyme